MSEGSTSQPTSTGFPQLAPLATPFVKLLLEREELQHFKAPLSGISMHEQMESARQRLQHIWLLLEQRAQDKRLQTFTLMNSAVQVDSKNGGRYVSSAWLRETLSSLMPRGPQKGKRKDSITAQALAVWNEKNILRSSGWGQVEAQSAATIIMARLLDQTRERFWLPSEVHSLEPHWWCFSQALPVNGAPSPIIPCPIPLITNLPPSTLLWTPWLGAGWDPCWLQIGSLGAIRWAGATLDQHGRVQWNMSESDLRKWDPEIVALDMGFLRHTKEMLNGVAHMALLRLALTRLQTTPLI